MYEKQTNLLQLPETCLFQNIKPEHFT